MTILADVPSLDDRPQVRLSAPPPSILESATKLVTESFARLPANADTAIVPIFHYRQGKGIAGNLAVVHRFNDHAGVVAWIGKDWGEPIEAGAAAVITWK